VEHVPETLLVTVTIGTFTKGTSCDSHQWNIYQRHALAMVDVYSDSSLYSQVWSMYQRHVLYN